LFRGAAARISRTGILRGLVVADPANFDHLVVAPYHLLLLLLPAASPW